MITETTQQRLVKRYRGALHPPVVIDRGYVVPGYLIYAVLGYTLVHYGAPSLIIATSIAFTTYLGLLIMVLSFVSAIFAARDVWYRFEAISTFGIACAMSTYCAAVSETLLERDGTIDDLRASFGVLVLIATAVMWARTMTLARLWVFTNVPNKDSK